MSLKTEQTIANVVILAVWELTGQGFMIREGQPSPLTEV